MSRRIVTDTVVLGYSITVERLETEVRNLVAEGWTELEIRVDEWDEDHELRLCGKRLETPEEVSEREALAEKARLAEAKRKAVNRERDRKTYERLKKRFESKP